jgi:hypothetical protein
MVYAIALGLIVYVRIAFPLFLPLSLTVSSPTATTGSLGYLYSVGVHDSIDLTKYTSMVLKVYNVRVETGWEKRVGGLNRDMSGGEYSIQCKTAGKGYI